MRRLLCWLFGHKPFGGRVERRLSLYFHCSRCRRLVPGLLSTRRS